MWFTSNQYKQTYPFFPSRFVMAPGPPGGFFCCTEKYKNVRFVRKMPIDRQKVLVFILVLSKFGLFFY